MPPVRSASIRNDEEAVRALAGDSSFLLVTESYAEVMRERGLDVRELRDFAVRSNLVLRWRRDDPNPALRRFLEGSIV
jgi:hypothetical protein